jgi:heme exporter protein D
MPEFRFDSLSDFLAMGGYAGFVWFSYLAFALVVVWNFWQPRLERKRIVRLLRAREYQQLHQAGTADARKQQSMQQQQGPAS